MKPSASFGLVPYWTTGQVAVQAKGKGIKKKQIWSTSKSMGASFEDRIHVCNHVVPCLSHKTCCLPICSISVVYWYFFSAISSQISKDILLKICWILFGKFPIQSIHEVEKLTENPELSFCQISKLAEDFLKNLRWCFYRMASVTFRFGLRSLQSKHWNLRGKCAATNLGTHVDAFIKLKGTGIIVVICVKILWSCCLAGVCCWEAVFQGLEMEAWSLQLDHVYTCLCDMWQVWRNNHKVKNWLLLLALVAN